MAINFPDNPTPNDTFTDVGKSWIWDGTTWKIYSSTSSGIGLGDLSVNTSSVGTAALSYNSTTGVFTYTPPDLSGYLTQQYTLPTASTTVLGGVKVDGSTINIANGVISGANTYSLPTATTTVLGGVKIDGTTITINNGVITASSSSTTNNLNLTDESGDTECFPVFCGAPTNDQTPHTNTSLKFNSTSGELSAGSFKKTGGTSSEFLKADGSIDSTSYLSSYTIPNSGVTAGSYTNSNITVGADGRVTAAASGSAATNIPLGGIIMWYGSTGSIPSGWSLCNGATVNGYATPNLQDKFVVGAGSGYAVNATGGAATDTVNISDSASVVFGANGTGTASKSGSSSATVSISDSDTVNTLPPYHALCYIMRTS